MKKENAYSTHDVLGFIFTLIREKDVIWEERIAWEIEFREKKAREIEFREKKASHKKIGYKEYLKQKEDIDKFRRLNIHGGDIDELLMEYGKCAESFYESIRRINHKIYDNFIYLFFNERFNEIKAEDPKKIRKLLQSIAVNEFI